MKGKVLVQKWIERSDLTNNPNTVYVFGDNMQETGYGGQAGAMRGEPNAFGIPTKWSPGMRESDFFTDKDLKNVSTVFDEDFRQLKDHISAGRNVVFPADGLGTGLSQLPQRAPLILDYIRQKIRDLKDFANE